MPQESAELDHWFFGGWAVDLPGEDGGVVVPVPGQPIALSEGRLAFARRDAGDVPVRVLTLEMMVAIKESPRPDEVGGAKDRADLAALRSAWQQQGRGSRSR